MDQCIAVATAHDFPILIWVGDGSEREILQALDYGAVGIVVPHVDSVEKAQSIARMARLGIAVGVMPIDALAGYATQSMPDLLRKSRDETVVIAQVEEPEAVLCCKGSASIEGIDGLFVGPADLSVDMVKPIKPAKNYKQHCAAWARRRAANKAYMSFVAL